MGNFVMNISKARRNLIARQSGEHCHDFPQLLFGLHGQMACEFVGETGELSSGNLAIVPSDEAHLFSGLSDDSELFVIDLAPLDPFINALETACQTSFKETLFQQPDIISLNDDILPLLDFAAGQLARDKGQLNPQINCQLVSLFMTQLSQLYGSRLTNNVLCQRLDMLLLNRFIDRRLFEPPSNLELADIMHVSESHFYALCQQQIGMAPQQYVMSRRMAKAQYLLTQSRMTLASIAAETGFSDASSFSRAYKNYYQKTPGSNRR